MSIVELIITVKSDDGIEALGPFTILEEDVEQVVDLLRQLEL